MSSKSLRAGASIVDISPAKGIELAGYPHYPRYNTGIHDPLYANCLFLDDGRTKIAIVAMDLLQYSKAYVSSVRNKVSRQIDIPPANIMICASHTHSGPWASSRLDFDGLGQNSKPDSTYIANLEKKLVAIVVEAYNNARNAKIGIDKGYVGREQRIGGNRRDPNGIADPEVWTVGVQDSNGKWIACLVKYALHPTILHADNTLVSADYPGYIREYFAKTKPGMIFLFAQGTSGNQSTRFFRQGQTFKEANRIGLAIGAEANRVLNSLELSSNVPLIVKSEEIELELKKPPTLVEAEANLRETIQHLEALKAAHASYTEIQTLNLHRLGAEATLAYVRIKERGERIELYEDEHPVEIQIIGIGDNRIVCLPGEVFVEFGLAIQRKSPYKNTFVIELANGCLPGYVCTPEAYVEGGYETGASLLTDKAGEMMVETALKLINET